MSDGQMSLQDIINGAMQAEQQGIPVDWKELCMRTYNVASNELAKLNQQLDSYKNAEEDKCDTATPAIGQPD